MTNIIIAYLALINIATFIAYGIDKRRAKKKQWRISESCLIMLAIVGGAVGAWLGMTTWRHKTQHKKFRYGIPAIFVLQAILAIWIIIH